MKNDGLSRRTFLKVVGASPLLSLIPASFISSHSSSVSTVSSESYSALELFGGGKAIVDRMDKSVRTELKKWQKNGKMPEILCYMEGDREITPERIHAVTDGREKVDYAFYEAVGQFKLDISMNKILGQPNFKDEATRNYWESKKGNMALESYVSLRAHEELAHIC